MAPSVLFDLLLAEWHLPAPNLVVSLVGEERPFAVKSWLRDVLRKGLVKAAQSTGDQSLAHRPRRPSLHGGARLQWGQPLGTAWPHGGLHRPPQDTRGR